MLSGGWTPNGWRGWAVPLALASYLGACVLARCAGELACAMWSTRRRS